MRWKMDLETKVTTGAGHVRRRIPNVWLVLRFSFSISRAFSFLYCPAMYTCPLMDAVGMVLFTGVATDDLSDSISFKVMWTKQ